MELRHAPRRLVPAEQQAQYGHEVALAATEAAVQICGLAAPALHRAAHEPKSSVERIDKRRRDDVRANGFGGALDAAAELQDEVALADLLGQLEKIAHPHALGHRSLALVCFG